MSRCGPTAMADFIAKIDEWMQGTVWLTRCSNYFRAPNGRVVTQWPRSARGVLGDDPSLPPRRLHLRPAGASSPPSRSALRRGEPVAPWTRHRERGHRDAARSCIAGSRRRPAPTCRRTCCGVVRDSLNQRRAESSRTSTPSASRSSTARRQSIPVRIYRGGPRPAPAVIYCHSGAFVLGNLDTDHRQCVRVRQARPLHGGLRRLPVGAGTPAIPPRSTT